MNRKEVSEIRKLYKNQDNITGKVAGCYCNADGIKGIFIRSFLQFDAEESFKYLEMFKKGLSGTLGKNIYSIKYASDDTTESIPSLLEKVRVDHLNNEDLLEILFQQLITKGQITENTFILIVSNAYDVIEKNRGESETVYDYLHVFICSAKLEKPGLTWNGNCLEHKELRWCIEAPEASFLYPSFEDRAPDQSIATIYVKKPEKLNEIEEMIGTETLKSSDEQTNDFTVSLTTALNKGSDKVEIIKSIQKKVSEFVEERETTELDKQDVNKILQGSGLSEDEVESFSNIYPVEKISAVNIVDPKKIEIKSPDIVVKVKKEVSHAIETSKINGKNCLVIDLGAVSDVEINGVNL